MAIYTRTGNSRVAHTVEFLFLEILHYPLIACRGVVELEKRTKFIRSRFGWVCREVPSFSYEGEMRMVRFKRYPSCMAKVKVLFS